MFEYAVGLLQHAKLRAQVLRQSPPSERGASALEWAIISAIIAVAALVLATTIRGVIQDKQSDLNNL